MNERLETAALKGVFSALGLAAVLMGAATFILLPLSPGKILGVAITLAPISIYVIGVQSRKGALLFGPPLVLLTGLSWLPMLLTDHEMRGFLVLIGAAVTFILVLIGAVVDEKWRGG